MFPPQLRRNLKINAAAIALVILTIWAVSIMGFLYESLPIQLALIPRTAQWWGVFSSPLVHRDLTHLLANTGPLIIFLALLQIRGSRTLIVVLSLCWILSGLLLWLFGRSGAHIGASGLVFALFGYLIAISLLARRVLDVLIALFVVVGYWGLSWGLMQGLLPGDPFVSWDGHLAGMFGGICGAWLLNYLGQRSGQQQS